MEPSDALCPWSQPVLHPHLGSSEHEHITLALSLVSQLQNGNGRVSTSQGTGRIGAGTQRKPLTVPGALLSVRVVSTTICG